VFGAETGVLRTVVGYCGGTMNHPTYEDMGDHSESTLVEFDPTKTSYERMLALFFASHSPSQWSRQYRSAILYLDENQKTIAEAALAKRGESAAAKTKLEPCGKFTPAEFYHQHYYLQNNELFEKAFASLKHSEYIDSFTCMRLNAIISRRGDGIMFEKELGSYQLPSDKIRASVRELIKGCVGVRYGCE